MLLLTREIASDVSNARPRWWWAIGFQKIVLNAIGTMVECNYSTPELHDWCQTYVTQFCAKAAQVDQPYLSSTELKNRVFGESDLLDQRLRASVRFKHPDFSYESEVRLIVSRPRTAFRISGDGSAIIPYTVIDLPNDELPVAPIAGPNKDLAMAEGSLNCLQVAARTAGTNWHMLGVWNRLSTALRQ